MSPDGSDRSPWRSLFRRRVPGITALLLATVVLAGCSSAAEGRRLGVPEPATQEGARILNLWQGAWVAALCVGAVVWGLILWSSAFHRKRGDELPQQVRYNVPIEALYTVVPFIIVLVFYYFTARDQHEIQQLRGDATQTVNVVGKRWSWDFNYIDEDVFETGTPGEPPTLVLPVDERIRFRVTSPDVIHSFFVPAFLYKMDIIPGVVNQFELTPSREGTFAGKCAELCGVDHARMLFNVRVVPREEFDSYIESLRERGQTGTVNTGQTRSRVEEPRTEEEGEE